VRRTLLALGVAVTVVLVPAGAAGAHPLGNFTVNTSIGLRIGPDRAVVDLVVDMAEIPTVQTRRGIDTDGDGSVSDGEAAAYSAAACPDAARRIDVTVDGRRAPVRSTAAGVTFPPGTAGLPTLRLTCALVADIGDLRGEREIELTSDAFTDRVGWREITAVGDRATLVASKVPEASASPAARRRRPSAPRCLARASPSLAASTPPPAPSPSSWPART
jgi:nickel/cobalt exporter